MNDCNWHVFIIWVCYLTITLSPAIFSMNCRVSNARFAKSTTELVISDHRDESRRNNFSGINMTKISGVYLNGFGEPVAGVQLVLTARTTSVDVMLATTAQQVTGADGAYSFDVLNGVYVVTASGIYLGVITVGPDSPDGTLNEYLNGAGA